jgi:C4-dicarboxylate transporter, DctQ subunit
MTALAVVAALMVTLMVMAVAFEVVMRYAFNRPTRWVIEMCEYALVYVAFLGGAWVLKDEGHVKVEFLVELFPQPVQRVFHVVTSLVGAAVCAVVTWAGAGYIRQLIETGEQLFRSVQIPKWTVLIVIPIGMALLAIQFIRRAFSPLPQGPGGGM